MVKGETSIKFSTDKKCVFEVTTADLPNSSFDPLPRLKKQDDQHNKLTLDGFYLEFYLNVR